MDIFPAIDIRSGRVVRLAQGDAARETVYGDDPAAQAERLAAGGARWIHVVDLDRAFGTGDNLAVVRRMVEAVRGRARIQLGGGIRDAGRLREAAGLGVARLVVGSAAVSDPALLDDALDLLGPDGVAVGIDARAGVVAIHGWTAATPLAADELASRVAARGVRTAIYTDIGRDGMLAGPDLDGAVALQALGLRVIASGGVASAAHVRAAARAGLAGVVVGRALYEGRLTLAEALAAAAAPAS